MRAIRSLASLVTCAALFLLASSAGAGTHSLGGRFTANRGALAQVPLVGLNAGGGLVDCHQLTFMTAHGPAGAVTVLPAPNKNGVNQRPAKGGKDLGCMPAQDGGMITTPAAGTAPVAGGAFVLPGGVFMQPGPAKINAIGLTTPPGFVEFATGNIVSGPPTHRDEPPGGHP